MKQKYIVFFLIVFLFAGLTSCVDSEEKAADEKLESVKALIRDTEYEAAKIMLDSMEILYPEQYSILNESRKLNELVTLSINETKLSELKTELDSQLSSVEALKKNFIYIPAAQNRPGDYEFKRQTARNSFNRIFLKAHLNDNGEFYISSNYYGNTWLSHTYIRVYDADLLAVSDTIRLSNPDNIKYEDGKNRWEEVSYKNGRDNGVVDLIIKHSDKKLKVRFSGKQFYWIVMEEFDKQAVKEGYELAQVLKRIYNLKTQISDCTEKIKRLKK
ncbi:hypothetical protein ACFLSI_02945 [Bacteroidota bacterium]